jgi:hypothetical protein
MPDRNRKWMVIVTTVIVNFFAIHGYLSIVAETTIRKSATVTLISLAVAGIAALVLRRRQPPAEPPA